MLIKTPQSDAPVSSEEKALNSIRKYRDTATKLLW